LLFAQLELPYEFVEIDLLAGEQRSAAFKKKNPNGKTPVVRLENGEYLWESNAILTYFADGTEFRPDDLLESARMLQWMFFEQNTHETAIAVARFITQFLEPDNPLKKRLNGLQSRGYEALQVMETHLTDHDWFAGGRYTIADIALYAYTHVADQGGFDLQSYPAIRRWITRVQQQPNYIPMSWQP
jgi:glutathione S-transferase